MANSHDKARASESCCVALIQCVGKGMTDADATASTVKGLIANIVARRDAVTTKGGQRTPFDLLIQCVQELANNGDLTDAKVNTFSTVAADPFVAGVATDMLSTCAASLPATIPDPLALKKGGMLAGFPSFSYQGAQ